jgi:hypothetical protein
MLLIIQNCMNRSIVTCRDAWTEFCQDIEPREAHGSAWRGAKSTKEGKFFSRRFPLFSAMKLLLEEGLEENDALNLLDDYRMSSCKGSLRKLCDTIAELEKHWNRLSEFSLLFQ